MTRRPPTTSREIRQFHDHVKTEISKATDRTLAAGAGAPGTIYTPWGPVEYMKVHARSAEFSTEELQHRHNTIAAHLTVNRKLDEQINRLGYTEHHALRSLSKIFDGRLNRGGWIGVTYAYNARTILDDSRAERAAREKLMRRARQDADLALHPIINDIMEEQLEHGNTATVWTAERTGYDQITLTPKWSPR